MIGRGAHMAGHSESGIEIGGAVLDVDALERVGVVAGPELVEIGHHTVVGATATAATSLHDEIGIFGSHALQNLAQSHVIVDIDLRLTVARKVRRTVVGELAIGIPFDIGDFGILRH